MFTFLSKDANRELTLSIESLREDEDRKYQKKVDSIATDLASRGLFNSTIRLSDVFDAKVEHLRSLVRITREQIKRILISDGITLSKENITELRDTQETTIRHAMRSNIEEFRNGAKSMGIPALDLASIDARADEVVGRERNAVELMALEVARTNAKNAAINASSSIAAQRGSPGIRTVQVLIASPSDVKAERDAVESALNDWNHEHTDELSVVFLRKRWEKDVVPAVGDRAQGIVNEQIEKKADILIAVFWTRIGTPTGKAESGSLEEIDEFIATAKPVQIYFCTRAIPQDADHEQYTRLRDWKKTISKTAIVGEFDSPDGLRQLIKNKLLRWVRDHRNTRELGPTALAAPVAKSPPQIIVPELIAGSKNAVVEVRINPTRQKGQRRQLAQVVAYNRGPGPVLIDAWFGVLGERSYHGSTQCVRGHLPVRLEEKSRLDITVALDFEWEELVRFGVEDAERRSHEVTKEDLERFIAVARQHMPPP